MIHTTVGVYLSFCTQLGGNAINGVDSEDLAYHIKYNKIFRGGRALFVDGECVQPGYLSEEQVQYFKENIIPQIVPLDKCTAPYH